MISTRLIVVLGAITVLFSGCASTSARSAPPRVHHGDGAYLDKGPTVTLDESTKPPVPTTLQLLDDQSQENGRLKTRLTELEAAVEEAVQRATRSEAEAKAKSAETENHRTLIEQSMSEHHRLTREVLASRIQRLRIEQEMLRIKIADIVGDAP